MKKKKEENRITEVTESHTKKLEETIEKFSLEYINGNEYGSLEQLCHFV